jgi:hypothetical protein
MARRIPKSELVVLDGGHCLLRHGTQVMSKTREFVSRHD